MDLVRDNHARARFELAEGGHIAFADYRREAKTLFIDHVETPDALRGTGAAGRLMQGVADAARGAGETIMPVCSYAAAWLKRNGGGADPVPPTVSPS